jgi:hypothetical protein
MYQQCLLKPEMVIRKDDASFSGKKLKSGKSQRVKSNCALVVIGSKSDAKIIVIFNKANIFVNFFYSTFLFISILLFVIRCNNYTVNELDRI